MKTTNIYVLLDPNRKHHGYIGKSDDPKKRFKEHFKDARGNSQLYVHRWIRKIWKTEKQPTMVVQHWDVKMEDWTKLEKQTIKLYKVLGWKLKNLTEGGENPPVHFGNKFMLGEKHSVETRMKIRKNRANQIIWAHTEEAKLKISIANTGKVRSEETCRKISESKKGNQFWLGKKHTDTTKLKMSKSANRKGETCPASKLNNQAVKVIRYFKGKKTVTILAKLH